MLTKTSRLVPSPALTSEKTVLLLGSTWLRTAKTAGWTLTRVLRNAGFSILVGWWSGFVYTLGNVASGKPPAEQSYASYVTANGVWFHGVFSATMITISAFRLTPEKFVVHSKRKTLVPTETASRPLTLMQCGIKILRHMTPHLAFSTVAEAVGCYMLIRRLPESDRKYKPAMYMNSFWSNYVLASAEFCTRSIFNSETVRGLTRRQLRESGQQRQQDGKPHRHHRPTRRRYSRMSSIRRFVVLYLQTLPGVVSSVIAIVYVHSISLFATIDRESELLAFAIGSIALKLTLQEVAKRYLLSTKEPLARR
ncbi:hypothetical protein PF004_g20244 [Phytophthora fragariae]|uniref:Uncharacterized protein n=1 Tax=Phytophthora fragariae TaxID=53985 RepID=A0A6G0N757_9STRA|nr:hypothetical protein PF004_g20244 [Phytophthora fragariae]